MKLGISPAKLGIAASKLGIGAARKIARLRRARGFCGGPYKGTFQFFLILLRSEWIGEST